jgi:hypothetical protein
MSDIEYIGYFYGKNGNESIKTAYARVKKEHGRAPDFFMNAELFNFSNRKAASDVVSGGVAHRLTESYGIAFPDNKKAVFSYKNNVNALDYIGAYPVLVRNGKAESSEPSGTSGNRGRTALGVGKDNLFVALVPDGSNDVNLAMLRSAFIKCGAENAINLDGGGSTQFYSPLGNHYTGRCVRGFVGVWLKQRADVRTVKVRTFLNVRTKPSNLGKRVGKLYNGDVVTVLETKGSWCRIATGWVKGLYLKK